MKTKYDRPSKNEIVKPMHGVLIPGEWYWAPSICMDEGFMAVLPNMHQDEGLQEDHYNLDGRFLSYNQRKLYLKQEYQTVFLANTPKNQQKYNRYIETPATVPQKCMTVTPIHRNYYVGKLNRLFESACNDMKMTNMKCPHRGTDLSNCPIDDGIVTCPAHGMRWRVADGSLIKESD